MFINYLNLDEVTRGKMSDEIQRDIELEAMYFGKRLSPKGIEDYPALIIEAASDYDDEWLANQLNQSGRLKSMEEYGKYGKVRAVPYNAAETLALGEFNRFYIRGLCLRAVDEGVDVTVYRGKESMNARSSSEALIGASFSPESLLEDIRGSIGVDTGLGLPPGPNSGLTIKL